jgi:hypothetical protein
MPRRLSQRCPHAHQLLWRGSYCGAAFALLLGQTSRVEGMRADNECDRHGNPSAISCYLLRTTQLVGGWRFFLNYVTSTTIMVKMRGKTRTVCNVER